MESFEVYTPMHADKTIWDMDKNASSLLNLLIELKAFEALHFFGNICPNLGISNWRDKYFQAGGINTPN